MDLSPENQHEKSKGVAIIGFLLVVVILFGLLFFIVTVGYVFYSDSVLRSSLEDSLQDAQGKMALWVEDPTRDPTAFNNALREVARDYESSLGQLGSSVRTLNVRPRDINGALLPDTFRVAVLPPGFCADVPGLSQPRVCNSHLENANARTGNARTFANQQMAAGSSYQDKVRTFPTEIVAFYEVNLPFVGRIQRKVVAAGYPRLLMAQNVSTSSTSTTSTSTTSTTTTSLPTTTSTTPFTTTTTVGGGPTTTTTWIGSSTTTTAQNTTTTRRRNSTTTVPTNSTTTVSATTSTTQASTTSTVQTTTTTTLPPVPCSYTISVYYRPCGRPCTHVTSANGDLRCRSNIPTGGDGCWSDDGSSIECEGTYYFDENCNRMGQAGSNVCGTGSLVYTVTPISLIWDEKIWATSEPTVVKFQLGSDNQAVYTSWYASEAAPLLVHDPKHLGKIESGKQLFGNYTFGGKRVGTKVVDWQDGFEALESLDLDKDGVLSVAELVDLGLWFDRNRDGFSQVGEVKTLQELQVTKIFVRSTHTKAVPRAILAEPGYERTVNNEKITGRSIDWFGQVAYGNDRQSSELNIVEPATVETMNNFNLGIGRKASAQPANAFFGLWKWKASQLSGPNAPEGYVRFFERNGTLAGNTQFGSDFRDRAGKTSGSLVKVVDLSKVTTRVENGATVIRFSVEFDSAMGEQAVTEVSMTGSGELVGRTRQFVQDIDTKRIADYEWTAQRVTK